MADEVVIIGADGTEHVFPAGFDPKKAADIVRRGAPTPIASHGPAKESWTDTAVNALPLIGGAVGGTIGGLGGTVAGFGVGGLPGAVGGAAIGGAGGEGFKQAINAMRGKMDRVPPTVGQQLADIGTAGAIQGGTELIAGTVVKPVAKGVYGLALRPIKSLRDKYGLKALVDAGFEGGVLPTKGGAAKAMGQMAQSKAAQRGMVEAYDAASGLELSPVTAATRGLRPMIRQARTAQAATGSGGEAATKIAGKIKSVMTAHPTGMSATRMFESKQAADAIADPAFAAARRTGGFVEPGSEAAIAKGWSKGYRSTLNQALGPEYAQQGLKTKTLYGLSQAADYAAQRPEAATNIMSLVGGAASSGGDVGEGLKNALLMRTLLSPRVQAGTALLAMPTFRYGTRALDAATGSNIENALREALVQALIGEPGGSR